MLGLLRRMDVTYQVLIPVTHFTWCGLVWKLAGTKWKSGTNLEKIDVERSMNSLVSLI